MVPGKIHTRGSRLLDGRADDSSVDEASSRLCHDGADLLSGGARYRVAIHVDAAEIHGRNLSGNIDRRVGRANGQHDIAPSYGSVDIDDIFKASITGPLAGGGTPPTRSPNHLRAAGRGGGADGCAHVAGMKQCDGPDIHNLILRNSKLVESVSFRQDIAHRPADFLTAATRVDMPTRCLS